MRLKNKKLMARIKAWFTPAPPRKPKRWYVLPARTDIPGKIPTLDILPLHNMVAVNVSDDAIYRNISGEIIKYTRTKNEDQA